MLRNVAAPTRQALALLSEASVGATLTLDGIAASNVSEPLPAVPPHPGYGTLETTLGSLWFDLHAIGAHDAEGLFNRRGLLLPSPYLLPALAQLKLQRELRASHFSLLGPRGAYLMSLAAQSSFSSGDPFLPSQLRAAFAKTASDRQIKLRPLLIGFALGTAQATRLSPKRTEEYRSILCELIELSEVDALAKACITTLVRKGLLSSVASADQIVAAMLPAVPDRRPPGPPSTNTRQVSWELLRQCLLLAVSRLREADPQVSLGIETELRKAEHLLASFSASPSHGLDLDRFHHLALAAHLARSSPTAAQLFRTAIHDENLLLRNHPALAACLAAMDAEDYARSISDFASASKSGWADPLLGEFLSVGTHTLNTEDSRHLATDALRGLSSGRTALGLRFILKLHPDTIGLLHDFDQRPHYGTLPSQMLRVLAKAAEVNRVYPVDDL